MLAAFFAKFVGFFGQIRAHRSFFVQKNARKPDFKSDIRSSEKQISELAGRSLGESEETQESLRRPGDSEEKIRRNSNLSGAHETWAAVGTWEVQSQSGKSTAKILFPSSSYLIK